LRLVSWNANYNRHRRSLDDSAALLADFGADILILCESGRPAADSRLSACYVGGVPGLGVVARPGLRLEPHPENDAAPDLLACYRVSGDACFDLVAVWPVHRPDEFTYHEILMAALDHYSDVLSGGRAVMMGDFNSSTKVRSQARTHQRFVTAAAQLGLASVYHANSGEAHGVESVSTYLHSSGTDCRFHIDYCFVSQELLAASALAIPDDQSWMALSDHYPLVADIQLPPL
jgi:hypothetical protein